MKRKILVILAILQLISCFLVRKVWAANEPKFYIYDYVEFENRDKKEKILDRLKKKYLAKTDAEGYRKAVIPASVGKKYFIPKPKDVLFCFFDSKFRGKAVVKDYVLFGGGYQSDDIYFNLKSGGAKFHDGTNGFKVPLYISMPGGMTKKETPREFHPSAASEKVVAEVLNRPNQISVSGQMIPLGERESTVSFDFPDEGVKIFEVKWKGAPGPISSRPAYVYLANDEIHAFDFYQMGDSVSFDQTFQVLGKKYIVFHVDTGFSDECVVLRVDLGSLLEVARNSVSYD